MKTRGRITQKMSRDGLVEHNSVTGENKIISKREAEINLSGEKSKQNAYSKDKSKNDIKKKIKKKITYKYNKPTEIPKESQNKSPEINRGISPTPPNQPVTSSNSQSFAKRPGNSGKFRIKKKTAYRNDKSPALKYTKSNTAKSKSSKPEQSSVNTNAPVSMLQSPKSKKLQFNKDKAVPEKPKSRKLVKAERQVERTGKKLEKAKNNLPAKRKLRYERIFDEKIGKANRKLHFEKEVKTQGEHLKGAKSLRPVKAGLNTVIVKAHGKIHQVEHENVGIKAAHRIEMIAEGGIRSAIRYHKTAPYRKVAKLERQAAKKSINMVYQKTLAGNPNLKSNVFSRMWQKRKIKKEYAKKAREAQKTAKKAGKATTDTVKNTVSFVAKHPVATIIILLISLLTFLIMSMCSMGGGMGGSGISGIVTSSYLAEDDDIDNAEIAYTEWETNLRLQIANAEINHPDYDEYKYNIGNIGHNPYELMAYLTAVYQEFTFDDISSELQAIFNEQYSLIFTETTETRYTEPDDEDDEPMPYEYKILTVTLESHSFIDVIFSKMDTEQLQHYSVLMTTKGGRQYAGSPFNFNWLPYIIDSYGWRIHPITGIKDFHRGIDIGLPTGTEIHSAQDGTVTFTGDSGDYGNIVVIENDKGIVTKYAHCDGIYVSEGQKVTANEFIATVGNTGNSTNPHLHFEILINGKYLNPIYFTHTGG